MLSESNCKVEPRVPEDLFKGIKYYFIGRISNEVKKMLNDGGAKKESYLTDMVTHVIAENGDSTEVSEAKELFELPVVLERWVILSVKCGCQLPLNAFNPESNQLFSGVVACTSQLPANDSKLIWVMVTYNGGRFQVNLNKNVTHLITGSPFGKKYDLAMRHSDRVRIVMPDWVTDSTADRCLLDETLYHPRLARPPTPPKPPTPPPPLPQPTVRTHLESPRMQVPMSNPLGAPLLGMQLRAPPPGVHKQGAGGFNRLPSPKQRSQYSPQGIPTSAAFQPAMMSPTGLFPSQQHSPRQGLPRPAQQGHQQAGMYANPAAAAAVQKQQAAAFGKRMATPSAAAAAAMQQRMPYIMYMQNLQNMQNAGGGKGLRQTPPPSSGTGINMQMQGAKIQHVREQVPLTLQQAMQARMQAMQQGNFPGMMHRPMGMQVPGQVMQGACQGMPGPGQGMPGPGQGMPGPGQGMAGPGQGMAGPGQGMQGPGQGMHGPGQGMHGPGQGMQALSQAMQGPGQAMQALSQSMQGSGQGIQAPGMQVIGQPLQGPGQGMQRPGQGIQVLSQGMQGPGQAMQNLSQTMQGPGQSMQVNLPQNMSGGLQTNAGSGMVLSTQQGMAAARMGMSIPPSSMSTSLGMSMAQQSMPSNMGLSKSQQSIATCMGMSVSQQSLATSMGGTMQNLAGFAANMSSMSGGHPTTQSVGGMMTGAHSMGMSPMQQGIPKAGLGTSMMRISAAAAAGGTVASNMARMAGVPPRNLSPQQMETSTSSAMPTAKSALVRMINNRLHNQEALALPQDPNQHLGHLQNMMGQQLHQQQIAGMHANATSPRALRNISNISQVQWQQQHQQQQQQQQQVAAGMGATPQQSQTIYPTSVNQLVAAMNRNRQQQQQDNKMIPSVVVPPVPDVVHYFGHDPQIRVPAELCLLGCIFVIVDYERIVDSSLLQSWWKVIEHHGGEVLPTYQPRCTHLMCDNQKSAVYQQKKMAPPWRALHLPTLFAEEKPLKNHIICVSNFEGEERVMIKAMIVVLGAKYTGFMTRHNTVLISRRPDGKKYEKARLWRLPVVNVQWLHDLLAGLTEPLRAPDLPKYTQMHASDPFKLDVTALPTLMNGWKLPVPIAPEQWKTMAANCQLRMLRQEEHASTKRKASLPNPPINKKARYFPEITEAEKQSSLYKKIVLFTSFPKDIVADYSKKLIQLGGEVAVSPQNCTHMVCPAVQRTVKFLCGISKCKHIVTPMWIEQSFRVGMFVDESKFVLEDIDAERDFDFNLRESMIRAQTKPVFQGLTFYATPSVHPPPTVLKEIIECAGGSIVVKRPSCKKIKELNQNGSTFIVVSCDKDAFLCRDLMNSKIRIYNAEFIMMGALRQEVDFVAFMMESSAAEY
ncbi:PREDICTED: PAX-interacting protein 1-like isoform X2 [Priapulus caudatus]|uniref:PAX-interacting protein 1 n=1 Tax=Priapulus caudatus TaxID=37621 RepID=A0ABM1E069_PRICU|nr:PREDICTED: PAX-interacting protein 1-like isoform X2 [Priapulus caudatus]